MQVLNLPSYPFKIKREGSLTQIFDIIRKKWVILQPEEWVRQHVVWYLIEEKGLTFGFDTEKYNLDNE